MGDAVIAFSGGADSSFLLKIASDTLPEERLLAVTAVSDTYTRSELKQAKRFARALGVRHKLIFTKEMKDRNFIKNPPDRCYYCKKELFNRLRDIAKRGNFKFILDASNEDDKKDYRPGNRAKKEFLVRSPLQEVHITKDEIKRYSKTLRLKTWSLPPMPCLASRVPYGEKISGAKLKKIQKAEDFIRHSGITLARVRHHGDIARIEVEKKDIKRFFNRNFCDKIIKYIKKLGFGYVALDLEGYRTGSLNEGLKRRRSFGAYNAPVCRIA